MDFHRGQRKEGVETSPKVTRGEESCFVCCMYWKGKKRGGPCLAEASSFEDRKLNRGRKKKEKSDEGSANVIWLPPALHLQG